MKLGRDRLEEIASAARRRYETRLAEQGPGVRALGWDTSAHQSQRFAVAAELFEGDTLLDVGCGFGDLLAHLQARGRPPSRYLGVDLIPAFVDEARRRVASGTDGAAFAVTDPQLAQVEGGFDTVVALGLLNHRLASDDENYAYLETLLEAAWGHARRCLVFDGISRLRDEAYPAEDWIFYADPSRVLAIASRLSPHFALRHDLPSLPQREYVVCLRRQPAHV